MHQQVLMLSDSGLAKIHDAGKRVQASDSVLSTPQIAYSVLSNSYDTGCKEANTSSLSSGQAPKGLYGVSWMGGRHFLTQNTMFQNMI